MEFRSIEEELSIALGSGFVESSLIGDLPVLDIASLKLILDVAGSHECIEIPKELYSYSDHKLIVKQIGKILPIQSEILDNIAVLEISLGNDHLIKKVSDGKSQQGLALEEANVNITIMSKKELKSFLDRLHPLNVGLLFNAFKRLDSTEITLDEFSERGFGRVKPSHSLIKRTKYPRGSTIRIRYNDLIRYLAENLTRVSIKDLGCISTSDLWEVLQYIEGNGGSINKKYCTGELEMLVFGVLRAHIIHIFVFSTMISKADMFEVVLNDLSRLVSEFKIEVLGLFDHLRVDELIELFNLISYYSELIGRSQLDESLETFLSALSSASEAKVKKHFNFIVEYFSYNPMLLERICHPRWLSLFNSVNLNIVSEDTLTRVFCNNPFTAGLSGDTKELIKPNLSGDSNQEFHDETNKLKKCSPNYTGNGSYCLSQSPRETSERPEITIRKDLGDLIVLENLPHSIPSSHSVIINSNLGSQKSLSFEICLESKFKLNFTWDILDLVKTWSLSFGIVQKLEEKPKLLAFNLLSVLINPSSESPYFKHPSVLFFSQGRRKNLRISNYLAPTPGTGYTYNCAHDPNYNEKMAENLGKRGKHSREKLLFAVDLEEKRCILVEIPGKISICVELDISRIEKDLQKGIGEVYPFISYNGNCFDITVDYYRDVLIGYSNEFWRTQNNRGNEIEKAIQAEITEKITFGMTHEERNSLRIERGSKTLRKMQICASREQPGAPKRPTRLRQSFNSTVIPMDLEVLLASACIGQSLDKKSVPKASTKKSSKKLSELRNGADRHENSPESSALVLKKSRGGLYLKSGSKKKPPVIKKIKKSNNTSKTRHEQARFLSSLKAIATFYIDKFLGFFRACVL
ncbi:hypothetical protein HWI79_3085 [Cryptosporidium felis]|nr:hypothetical protein HWI79_3085 [Cryptosporidium felis]